MTCSYRRRDVIWPNIAASRPARSHRSRPSRPTRHFAHVVRGSPELFLSPSCRSGTSTLRDMCAHRCCRARPCGRGGTAAAGRGAGDGAGARCHERGRNRTNEDQAGERARREDVPSSPTCCMAALVRAASAARPGARDRRAAIVTPMRVAMMTAGSRGDVAPFTDRKSVV